jgi:carbonic anhydrase
VVSCCDSRVDPALILQCDPGDLFVVRNVANIVPPYEKDEAHHGTSAALEFGIRVLQVKQLILLGHSQCGGIQALFNAHQAQNDFINQWVSLIKPKKMDDNHAHVDEYAKSALNQSLENCLTFPWIKEKVDQQVLEIHLWFFDVEHGQIHARVNNHYQPL